MIKVEQLGNLEPDLIVEVSTNGHGGDATRGFRAVDSFIKALAAIDGALAPWKKANVETVVLLEHVRGHSVVGWLRHSFTETDEQKKKAFVRFLNSGAAAIATWLNQLHAPEPQPLASVVQRIAAVAQELGLSADNGFQIPRPLLLMRAATQLQQAKWGLSPADKAFLVSTDLRVELEVDARVTSEEIEAASAVWRVRNEPLQLLLIADAPDYDKTGSWRFILDGREITATVEDQAWLTLFHARNVEVRPGDILRVAAMAESLYAGDGELIRTRYVVKTVLELMQIGRNIVPRVTPDDKPSVEYPLTADSDEADARALPLRP